MLLIRQSEAAVQISDVGIRQWVEHQFHKLEEYSPHWTPDELGWFAVWGNGDDPYDKGLFINVRNLMENPYDPGVSFEAVQDHGHFYEAVVLLSDLVSVAVLIPKDLNLSPSLSAQLMRLSSN